MKTLSYSQKKIFIVAIFAGLLFLLFWVFIYWPEQSKFDYVKSELNRVDREIETIEGLTDKSVSVEEGIRRLREAYVKIEFKFPAREEDALGYLSQAAQKYRIEVGGVNSQPKKSMVDSEEKNILVDGKKLKKVLVAMDLKGSYKDLVDYLAQLKDALPAFMTVEKLRITKQDQSDNRLTIHMEFYLYLLS